MDTTQHFSLLCHKNDYYDMNFSPNKKYEKLIHTTVFDYNSISRGTTEERNSDELGFGYSFTLLAILSSHA